MRLLAIIVILLIFIVILILMAVAQMRAAGINVKDFYSFIKANETLDELYVFAERYNKMSTQEQLIYLIEAEKMLSAFDKIPKVMWEDEHNKYSKVLNTYEKIRMDRWSEEQEVINSKKVTKEIIRPKEMKIS